MFEINYQLSGTAQQGLKTGTLQGRAALPRVAFLVQWKIKCEKL